MSHFITLVILPKKTTLEEVASQTAMLLQPYDDNVQVPPYETECGCVGIEARIQVEKKVNESFDTNQLREQFRNLPESERTDEKWAEKIAPVKELREQLLAEHPLKDRSNPECKSCAGTGRRMTQRNPASKWDSWRIGGRWNGSIFGPEREQQCADGKGGFNFGMQYEQMENNCRPVKDIPIDVPYYVPFSVVTPDGQWHEQGKMGYWAVVSNAVTDEQWHHTVKALLSKYSNHLAVAVDCHI